MATIVTASVVAQAKREVATSAGSPAAAYSLKNGGNTATMTVVQNAELAQSYIAQARSSGRPRPSRARSPIIQNVLRATHSLSSESTTT